MFCCGASLAIPHRKRIAGIASISLAHLGHMNRNVLVSHNSQRDIALFLALSRPIPDYQQGDIGERHGPLFRRVCVFDVSWAYWQLVSAGLAEV